MGSLGEKGGGGVGFLVSQVGETFTWGKDSTQGRDERTRRQCQR